MSIPARYSGVCPECGQRRQSGDLIRALLSSSDLSAAAAIVEVRATTANAPHLRALAARLIAARDAMGEPEAEEES